MAAALLLVMVIARDVARSGAPAVVVCGQTLYTPSGHEPPLYGSKGSLPQSIPVYHVGGPTLIQLSTGCVSGAKVAIRPRGVVSIHKEIQTPDGNIAALWLEPTVTHGDATLTATGPTGHRKRYLLRVR